jgi:lipid-A-disaccharide synthase
MMIAGEVSGDLHGSGVVRELRRRLPGVVIDGVGGDLMKAEGMETIVHINTLSVMGFAEVIRHIPALRETERLLLRSLRKSKPDVLVLIDYPGFNIRFARKAKDHGVKVLYYISPQVWAWRRGRIRKMIGRVDEMDVVFPFEVDLYRNAGIRVDFVGHPLLERLHRRNDRERFFHDHRLDPDKPLMALLPGSRKQEVRHILPTMLKSARMLREKLNVQAAIGASRGFGREFLGEFLRDGEDVTLIENDTYGLMEHAGAAVVTSGTATLETAWFGTPMVVVYRTSTVTFLIGKSLLKIPYIGLVNIVSGRKVVPELIQEGMTEEAIMNEVEKIFRNDSYARSVRENLAVVRQNLGTPGASARVAENIIALSERN